MIGAPPILHDLSAWDSASSTDRRAAIQLVADKIAGQFRFLRVEKFSCGGQSHEIGVFAHRTTGIQFHLLPGGEFEMGNTHPENEICEENGWGGDISETPAHEVRVAPFLVSRFMVTEGPWNQHGGEELHFKLGPDHPVDAISRKACRSWCTTTGLRLLHESEWEYACRAGTKTVFFWGNQPNPSYAWMKAHPVPDDYRNHTEAEHADKPNAFGLVDMLGSLAEWVEDDLHYYGDHDHDDGPFYAESDDPDGIQRGGCFMYNWNLCRSSTRIQCSDYGDTGMGLRVACSLNAAAKGEAPAGEAAAQVPPASQEAAKEKPWWKVW